jgi:hypothetical protein
MNAAGVRSSARDPYPLKHLCMHGQADQALLLHSTGWEQQDAGKWGRVMAIKWPKEPDAPKPADDQLGTRKCKVCEWEGQLIVKVGEDPDCPWCHAPTEPVAGEAAATVTKNPHAAALGRLGGLKGGHARARALTAAQRRRIASRAARARWSKTDKKDKKDRNGK